MNLIRFFDTWLCPIDQNDFAMCIERLDTLTIISIDGDMIDDIFLSSLSNGSGNCLKQLIIEAEDIYREAVYPWSSDGTTIEPINWTTFELSCKNVEIEINFSETVCDGTNSKYIINHFIGNATRITSIGLEREDIKNNSMWGFYRNGQGSTILSRKL